MSQITNTTRDAYTGHFRKTIEAGADVVVNISGLTIHFAEVESVDGAPLLFALDDGSFAPCNMGLTFTLPGGGSFSKVTLRNPNADPIVVEFYAGTIIVGDSRLSIVRGRVAPVMHAETALSGGAFTMEPDATIDLSDLATYPPPNPKYIRAFTIVTNMDAAVDIDIRNEAGADLAPVFFREPFLMQSSAPLKVHNPSAGDVVVRICQGWYVIR